MKKGRVLGNAMLILTAVIWGTAFVAQRVGMDYVGPLTFMATRYFLAMICLGIISFVIRSQKKKKIAEPKKTEEQKEYKLTILSGIVVGCFLFLGSVFQQIGLLYTTVGKASFITSLYIVLIPLIGIFLGRKISKITWFGVVLAIIGLYLLTIKEGFSISQGDLIVLMGSFVWSGHILSVDYFSKRVEPVYMSFLQFSVCFLLSVIAMFVFEKPVWKDIMTAWFSIFYAGVFSAGVGYTLQMIAQKNTDPTIASLILSLEAVFGVLAGYYFLNEVLTLKELAGCVILFAAIIVAQLPSNEESERLAEESSF